MPDAPPTLLELRPSNPFPAPNRRWQIALYFAQRDEKLHFLKT
jgi:hypothetical protein